MTQLDNLLGRLDGVRDLGNGQWLARCPSYKDRSPSLSIGVGEGGRLLLHCFAACGVEEVVAAAGLELRDLFPDRIDNHRAVRHSSLARASFI